MAVTYFAYGSNLLSRVFDEVCPGSRPVGPAMLRGYRLAFTRRSTVWQSGVADIVAAPGMFTWGMVYIIDEDGLAALDKKEGCGSAYDRIEVDVQLEDRSTVKAITYTVIDKAAQEIPPSDAYFGTLLEGAQERGLPETYIHFLNTLRADELRWAGEGLLVMPTGTRFEAHGMNLVKVSPRTASREKLGRMAVVVYDGKPALCKVITLGDLDDSTCQLDQSIRQALGFPGKRCHGSFVTIRPVKGRPHLFPLIRPRSLILPVTYASWADSEKNICVLHPNNIALLGLEEGEYVKMLGAALQDDGRYVIRQHSRRVFSGTADQIYTGEGLGRAAYPQIDRLYMDADGRQEIEASVGTPVIIRPDVWRLFASRSLFYGIALFLSLDALLTLTNEMDSFFGGSLIARLGFSLAVGVVVTIVFSLFDIRGRVKY